MVIFKKGDQGTQVRQIQDRLVELGFFKKEANGIFDEYMQNCVKDFQKSSKLKADGIIGPKTLKALNTKVKPSLPDKTTDLVFPKAITQLSMPTKGEFEKGYPKGVVVHFTAGHFGSVQAALNTVSNGKKNGYAFWCIASDGTVLQTHPVSRWGYHAGESAWKNVSVGKLVGRVSDDLLGIEITCGGLLTKKGNKFFTWFNKEVPPEEVRYVTEAEYGCPTGYYHKFTEAQEKSLIDIILWLKRMDTKNVFTFDNVLGHHEVSGKRGIGYWRKNDPGGSLSLNMDQFRNLLKEVWASKEIIP